MPVTEIESVFTPTPPQQRFLLSKARVRGYGGAMGGGKSRALCEDAFDVMLEFPGVKAVLARASHTSIVETTKKTMMEQVLPQHPAIVTRHKASQGEDFIELWNGSVCHFIGLDDPMRWYSSEIGWIGFDESQEIEFEKVIRLLLRLRQQGMPNRAGFAFNPSSPGHWLQRWFIAGAERTDFGFARDELFLSEDAAAPFGSCEFVFAKATDNPYLPAGYVEETLASLPERLRRRYLEGLWEYTEGNCFFDLDALASYQAACIDTRPVGNGRVEGDIQQDFMYRTKGVKPSDRVRVVLGSGPLTVWRAPVKTDEHGRPKPHRYLLSCDASSGKSDDYTAIQVLDIDAFEQVAEVQAKLTPDETAEWCYRLGRIYNDALVVCEVTGGWGFAVDQQLRKMRYPRPYTQRVLNRLSQRFTDKVGFDTTMKTRSLILSTLDQAIREGELGIYSLRTVNELGTFVFAKADPNKPGDGKPGAQSGCNDDLVLALAMGVYVALSQPKQLQRPVERPYQPQFATTGY